MVSSFFQGVFSGLSSTVFNKLFYLSKITYAREPRLSGVQREERTAPAFAWFLNCLHQNNVTMFNKPLQCKIQTSTETQLHLQYYISIKLVEKVKLIAKSQKLLSRHGLVTCWVILGTIMCCGQRMTTTALEMCHQMKVKR